ncbi:MAG: WYL domain-containing protein [Nitrospirae bacterium]|nr:WYL domain-containing protein [Nitrospirota bacterium]
MPRGDQARRQLFLLRCLESRRGATLQELADALPEDYPHHPRTIRRDLEALESVYPLVTERVDGRTRWMILEGFRNLPALAFTPTELMALTFSRNLLRPLRGTPLQASLDSAFHKMITTLPPGALSYLRQLDRTFTVGIGPHKDYRRHRETVDRLCRALEDRRTVQIRYASLSRGKTTRREVDPYHLRYMAGGLYLIGYCRVRRDVRLFAVDRIRAVTVTRHPYQIPLGFDVEAYMAEALEVMRGKPAEVELRFEPRAAAWVRERLWHPSQELAELPGKRLRMTLRVAQTPELIRWVAGFGGEVTVICPPGLRKAVREVGQALVRKYRKP